MKNKQQRNVDNHQAQPMPWPDKNLKDQEQSVFADNNKIQLQNMPWPQKKEVAANNEGNGMSIGNDLDTIKKENETSTAKNNSTTLSNPEINTPVYEPGKTEQKIPIMKKDLKGK